MATMTTEQTTLNSLLRGEMSAIETYRMGLDKLRGSNEPGVSELEAIRRDHRDAADNLWQHMEQRGERPSDGSGAWGAFARAVEGTAKLFGNAAALKALKEGEEHGLKDYQDALEDEHLTPERKAMLRTFISRQQAHIQTLDRLIAAQSKR
jgi:uncharacterized protein DUF2383